MDSKLGLSRTGSAARRTLLEDSFFDSWEDEGSTDLLGSPEETPRKDPLAAQIWVLYGRIKTQMPNAERMENLTWRMMSMNLRRKEGKRLRLEESAIQSTDHE
jgi:GATA-binding protein